MKSSASSLTAELFWKKVAEVLDFRCGFSYSISTMNDMIDTSSDLRDLITVDLGEVFTQDDADYEQRARWEECMTMEDIFEG